jgi:selenocysteine lyase/cysteine desulfurase
MITNVDLANKPSLTDEYWVEKITDNKIRYKYHPKRKESGTHHYGGCELKIVHYERIDTEAYKSFVDAIRTYTQQRIVVEIDRWVYVNITE